MNRKKHTRTLREELEDLNDYLDLAESRVRDEGKPRLTHDVVKKTLRREMISRCEEHWKKQSGQTRRMGDHQPC